MMERDWELGVLRGNHGPTTDLQWKPSCFCFLLPTAAEDDGPACSRRSIPVSSSKPVELPVRLNGSILPLEHHACDVWDVRLGDLKQTQILLGKICLITTVSAHIPYLMPV